MQLFEGRVSGKRVPKKTPFSITCGSRRTQGSLKPGPAVMVQRPLCLWFSLGYILSCQQNLASSTCCSFIGMQDVSVRGLWKLALRFLKDVENKQCCQTPCMALHTWIGRVWLWSKNPDCSGDPNKQCEKWGIIMRKAVVTTWNHPKRGIVIATDNRIRRIGIPKTVRAQTIPPWAPDAQHITVEFGV